ncbi:sensor histidine kinase [Oceanispirochaeta sp. M1]|uniref:sensor histidine kinase n=2 Tax=Oceanispirochaeta TaxID=2035349 RepID=UPI001495126C|nr:histidine kinase [Oceanispirochaeta sp. M1]
MAFFTKLILVVVFLFASIAVIVNFVNNNMNKNHSIELVNKSFINLTDKITLQISSHNSDNEYLQAIQDNHVSRKLVSSSNYSFSRTINVRYSYNIYDMSANPIYQESYHLLPQYKIYLNIIRDRVKNDSPIKYILYPNYKTHTASLIYYGGLYKDSKLIGFDMYSIDIRDLNYSLLPNTGDYVITDRFDSIIATNNYKILEKSLNLKYVKNYTIDNANYHVTRVEKDFYSIYFLEKYISLSRWYLIVFSIFLLILLVVVAFSYKIIKKIARENAQSFESIIADTNTVSMGNLDHRINENLDDDFNSLAINVNEMLDKLNSEIILNKELSETNSIFEKRKLDAQFNPHFLYNSLETIRYSMQYDVKGTEKYILDLTSILRYSISNNINYSSVENDLTYINKYLELFKYRFKEKLTYSITNSDKVKDVLIPKLAIQPLVSNSIKYGFAESLHVRIDISTEMIDDRCYIRIRDNGSSMTDEMIKEINQICKQKKNPTNHIGIHNVLRRFMILYPDALLNVMRDSEGTVFEITFKKKLKANV